MQSKDELCNNPDGCTRRVGVSKVGWRAGLVRCASFIGDTAAVIEEDEDEVDEGWSAEEDPVFSCVFDSG